MAHDETSRFATALDWKGPGSAAVHAEDVPRPIAIDFPREFGGPGDEWSPETLLVAAVETCTMLTFLALARRRGVQVLAYQSTAEGTLSTAPRESRFISFLVRPAVTVATEADKATAAAIFASLSRRCFVGASVKAEPIIDAQIAVRPSPLSAVGAG